jgi:hypothetical protein
MSIPAHYEPMDVEDEPDSNIQVKAHGNAPPNCVRKLKRSACLVCFIPFTAMLLSCQTLVLSPPAETYIEADDSSSDDSTMATKNGGTDSVSTEDKDSNELVQLTQNVKLSQKMAIEVSLPSLSAKFMTQDHLEAFLASRCRQCDGY